MICSIIATIGLTCGSFALAPKGFYDAFTNYRIDKRHYSNKLPTKTKVDDIFWRLKTTYGFKKEPQGYDYWTENLENTKYPDCEDYVLAVRKALMKQRYYGGNIALIKDNRRNNYHVVLIVPTTQGSYVVDTNYPNKLRSLPDFKTWIDRQNQEIIKVMTENFKWKKVIQKN
jgi:hypothetical protein